MPTPNQRQRTERTADAADTAGVIASAILSDVFDICQPAEGCSTAGLHSKVKAHVLRASSSHAAMLEALHRAHFSMTLYPGDDPETDKIIAQLDAAIRQATEAP